MRQSIIYLLVMTIFTLLSHAGVPNSSSVSVRSWAPDPGLSAWCKSGKMVFFSSDLGAGPIGVYAYKRNSGKWIVLTDRIDGVNEFLGLEIASVEAGNRFLSEQMARLLLSTMAPEGARIVDREMIELYEKYGDKRSLALLRKYESTTAPKIESARWSLEFYVTTRRGDIERWNFAGRLTGLAIISFLREIVEGPNSFRTVGVAGGTIPRGD